MRDGTEHTKKEQNTQKKTLNGTPLLVTRKGIMAHHYKLLETKT
jgi:hypothetical protein